MSFASLPLLGKFVAAVAIVCFAMGIRQTARAADIDTRELKLKVEVAFPDVKWPKWQAIDDSGVQHPLRPILLTGAKDGTNRVFIPTEQGVFYVLPNDQKATTAKVFLDLTDRVVYDDKKNEEGLLGLVFHPKYRENGYFYVYYTNKAEKHQNILARYSVKKDNPDEADPASEQVLITFDKPDWNHDGGTLAFGPDGYLYVAIGDGGSANDPQKNGQNTNVLLGKVLRLDVDHHDEGKNYAIPKDNPFVGQKDTKPETYAYGIRNIWRMAFDSKTGVLWAGDVGQDTYEEIDIIVKGGNYGWNIREGLHPFLLKGQKPPADLTTPKGMIDPIFEYHHDIGKSITGGLVYRGKQIPELDGAYLYADYVKGKLWALRYDFDKKQVTENREIPLPASIPVMSFGEDDEHEVYFTTFAQSGKGVYRLAKP